MDFIYGIVEAIVSFFEPDSWDVFAWLTPLMNKFLSIFTK